MLSLLNIEMQDDAGNIILCVAVDGCNNGDSFCTCHMDIPASSAAIYRMQIKRDGYPTSDIGDVPTVMQILYVEVTSYLSVSKLHNRTLYKVTEVFRSPIAKLLYLNTSQPQFIQIYTPDNNAADKARAYLYKVSTVQDGGATYVISGATELLASAFTVSYNATTGYENYTSIAPLAAGYYVLNVFYEPAAGGEGEGEGGDPVPSVYNFVRLRYDSDEYPCPYSVDYNDFYEAFQPCASNSTPAITNTITNITCPDRFYFHFGECLPVSERCAAYNFYTDGLCTSCKDPNDTLLNGSCIPPTLNCQPRQYPGNRTCLNVSVLCAAFDPATGACLTCVPDYQVLNNSGVCTLVPVVCNSRQYEQNRTCVDIPSLCTIFNSVTRRCEKCQQGYWPSLDLGLCQKAVCPPRQYPTEYFFCRDVSDLCATFDELTGDCLTCKDPDYTVRNGTCLQAQPLAGCQERQRQGFGPCTGASENCAQYSLVTGDCLQCLTGWFFDWTGRCTLGQAVCGAGEVSIQGHCMQLPSNCADYSRTTGLCVLCNSNYKNSNGQCLKVVTCPSGQYLSDQGQCANVVAGCAFYNPTSGVCLRCADGTLAVGGLCCSAGFYSYGGSCVDATTYLSLTSSGAGSSGPTCISWHPTLRVCL
jgi:hypothetical protein